MNAWEARRRIPGNKGSECKGNVRSVEEVELMKHSVCPSSRIIGGALAHVRVQFIRYICGFGSCGCGFTLKTSIESSATPPPETEIPYDNPTNPKPKSATPCRFPAIKTL